MFHRLLPLVVVAAVGTAAGVSPAYEVLPFAAGEHKSANVVVSKNAGNELVAGAPLPLTISPDFCDHRVALHMADYSYALVCSSPSIKLLMLAEVQTQRRDIRVTATTLVAPAANAFAAAALNLLSGLIVVCQADALPLFLFNNYGQIITQVNGTMGTGGCDAVGSASLAIHDAAQVNYALVIFRHNGILYQAIARQSVKTLAVSDAEALAIDDCESFRVLPMDKELVLLDCGRSIYVIRVKKPSTWPPAPSTPSISAPLQLTGAIVPSGVIALNQTSVARLSTDGDYGQQLLWLYSLVNFKSWRTSAFVQLPARGAPLSVMSLQPIDDTLAVLSAYSQAEVVLHKYTLLGELEGTMPIPFMTQHGCSMSGALVTGRCNDSAAAAERERDSLIGYVTPVLKFLPIAWAQCAPHNLGVVSALTRKGQETTGLVYFEKGTVELTNSPKPNLAQGQEYGASVSGRLTRMAPPTSTKVVGPIGVALSASDLYLYGPDSEK